jgi:hypothetical protein
MNRKAFRFVHVDKYAAKVEIELIPDDGAWGLTSPGMMPSNWIAFGPRSSAATSRPPAGRLACSS